VPRNYLSKRLALKICYELWAWLAENPSKDKEDWPGWEKYIKYAQGNNFKVYCPCCEWIWKNKGLSPHSCLHISYGAYCPLKSLWPKGCQNYRQKTAWDIWRSKFTTPSEVFKQAQTIADAAYKEWQKLEKKQ
jgi:hypothetical protein